jgi:uncharacterized membrane protein YidH (DUF202 family)
MSLAYSPVFGVNVIAGYLLTVLGAVLALASAVWWVWTEEGTRAGSRLPALRVLSTLAFALFVVGLFWQLAGYLRLNYSGAF